MSNIKARYPKVCKYCKRKFKGKTPWQKFCGTEHYQAFWREEMQRKMKRAKAAKN